MHKHGGDDTHPFTANEDGAGVIGAPGHELIVGGINGANTTQHHGDVDGAVDANEKIRSGRSSPGRPPAANGRRWRECTSASRCASGTPRRMMPTSPRLATPLFFSTISCASRTRVRSISDADRTDRKSTRLNSSHL